MAPMRSAPVGGWRLLAMALACVMSMAFVGTPAAGQDTSTAAGEAVAKPAMTGMAGFVEGMQGDTVRLRDRFVEVLAAPKNGPAVVAETYGAIVRDTGPGVFFIGVIFVVVTGVVLELAFRRSTATAWHQRFETAARPRFWARFASLLFRAIIELVGISVFAIGVLGAFLLFGGNETARLFVFTYLTATVILRLVSIGLRFFLSPRMAHLRIVAIPDAAAWYYYRWIMWVVGIGIFGNMTANFLQLRGTSEEVFIAQGAIVGLVIIVMLIVMVWQIRGQVAELIRGGLSEQACEASQSVGERIRGYVARIWHVVATIYLLVFWVLWLASVLLGRETNTPAVVTSLFLVVAFPLVDQLIRQGLVQLFSHKVEVIDGDAATAGPDPVVEPARALSQAGARSVDVVQRGFRILFAVFVIGSLLLVWGVNFSTATESPFLRLVARPTISIAFILVLAFIGYELIKAWVDERLADEKANMPQPAGGEEEAGEGESEPGSRLETLLPLFRKFTIGVIVVFVGLSVLSSLGVDIAPLLAGAGVLGIAIGFGAQSLVRDVFSGVFFLIDDAFRVGEYVELGGELKGTVEAMSVRSMRLRHHRGPVHTVPFGELRSITNRSRDWVIDKLVFRVPFDTDIEKVRKIIKKVGLEMMEDEKLKDRLLQPLKSQGLHDTDDTGLILRAKFMSKPRGRTTIRREAFRRVKEAFAANGVEFARRQVIVNTGDGADAAARGAAAAAAVMAAEEQAAEDAAKSS